MFIPIGIVVVLALAVVALLAMARQRSTTGRLSRETRRRDEVAAASVVPEAPAPAGEESTEELSEEGRARADEARRAIESGSGAGSVPEWEAGSVPEREAGSVPERQTGSVPERETGAKIPAVYEPVDPEELGVTRRQFFNRSLLAGTGLGLGAFGVASLAFLWPSSSAGLGGKITVGTVAAVEAELDKKIPFYNAGAKTYVVASPKADLRNAKKVEAYEQLLPGMEQGYVAIYQKCVHLGCRVPWCSSSQWFECPCHGSKYNRVGEKRGGPAPRGLDHFRLEVSGGSVSVDTSEIVVGAPVGTDTTGQSPEGAPCV